MVIKLIVVVVVIVVAITNLLRSAISKNISATFLYRSCIGHVNWNFFEAISLLGGAHRTEQTPQSNNFLLALEWMIKSGVLTAAFWNTD